jgi:quercetin 2,3-dioxygenase
MSASCLYRRIGCPRPGAGLFREAPPDLTDKLKGFSQFLIYIQQGSMYALRKMVKHWPGDDAGESGESRRRKGMALQRKIRRVFQSRPTLEGAGVHLNRAFAIREVPLFDPFLLLDDFRSAEPRFYLPGFPWHPHRGIETITYMLDGRVEHGDSMGNTGVIGPGDVQWMTAGSGIVHQEMPKGDSTGRMGGFQLWANLPAAHKMMDPRYRGVESRRIPQVAPAKGATVRVICGTIGNVSGPVRDVVTDPEYFDVSLDRETEFRQAVKKGHTVFAYIVDGRAAFCSEKNPFRYEAETVSYFEFQRDPFLKKGNVVLFTDGEELTVATEDDPVRFLLISGKPIGEPVAWYGPIVMNTQAELETAFEEFERGTFIKKKR